MIRLLCACGAGLVGIAGALLATVSARADVPPAISRPVSILLEGWAPLGDPTGCEVRFRQSAPMGSGALKLQSSDTPCDGTRSFALTFDGGRAQFLANIVQDQASANFTLTLQYRFTDAFSGSLQEAIVTQAMFFGDPVGSMIVGLRPLPVNLFQVGASASGSDSLTRFSLDYTPNAPWSVRASFTTSSLYAAAQGEIQYPLTSEWSARATWSRTQGEFGTADSLTLSLNGTLFEAPIEVAYGVTNSTFLPELEGVAGSAPLAQPVNVPTLSLTVTEWGWRWGLSGTGGAYPNLTLQMERVDDGMGVILSSNPLTVWGTYKIQF